MSTKKSRAERNLKFETLQLHVGQENPDPVMWFWVHDRWKDGRERFAVRK